MHHFRKKGYAILFVRLREKLFNKSDSIFNNTFAIFHKGWRESELGLLSVSKLFGTVSLISSNTLHEMRL